MLYLLKIEKSMKKSLKYEKVIETHRAPHDSSNNILIYIH